MKSTQVLLILFALFAVTFLVQFVIRAILSRTRERKSIRQGPRVKVRRSSPLPRGLPIHARERQAPPTEPAIEVDEALIEEMKRQLEEIPPVPVVVQRVIQEIANPKSSAASVAAIAQTDPVLAATFLKAINTSAYGVREKITSLDQAIGLLGYRTVQALVMQYGFSRLFPQSGSRKGYRTEDLWVHSLAVCLSAQALVDDVEGVDAGMVATLGLLHDIGKFVIASKYPRRIDHLWAAGDEGDASYLAREKKHFGHDHTVIGAHLARKWSLPQDLVLAIRLHHQPTHPALDQLSPAARKAVGVVFLANQLTKYCHAYCEDVEVDLPDDALFTRLGLVGPLEALLLPRVREAITKAIHFVDQVSPMPLPAVQRLVGVKTARELAGITSVPGRWLQDPILERIAVGTTPILDSLIDKETIRVETSERSIAQVERETFQGASDVTIALPPTEDKMRELVLGLPRVLEEMGWKGEKRFAYRFLVKYCLGNILHAGVAEGLIELRLRRGLEDDALVVRHPGLAFEHLIPLEQVRRTRGDDVARRIAQAVLGAGLGRILTLGWFDTIEATADGDAILLHSGG